MLQTEGVIQENPITDGFYANETSVILEDVPDTCIKIQQLGWIEQSRLCRSCMLDNTPSYIDCLDQRYSDYRNKSDYDGLYNTWSLLVDAHINQWPEMTRMRNLIEMLEEIRSVQPLFSSLPTAANVKLGEFAAIMLADPTNPKLGGLIETCTYFLQQSNDRFFRKRAAHYLVLYHLSLGNTQKINELVNIAEGDLNCVIA